MAEDTQQKGTILVVDDDPAIRISLKTLLRRAGYRPVVAAGMAEAVDAVRQESPALTLMDMNFSRATDGTEGLELLRRVKVLRPQMPVILMTAWGSIPLAVEGMKLGAADFISKPWGDNERLLRLIAGTIKLSPDAVESGSPAPFDRSAIIGESRGLSRVLDTLARVAPTDAPVLILGENGTGKEMIARAIHDNSMRRSRRFVAVNLGGIPRELFESEMFGHVKGAFTGAAADREGRFDAADGGTIFLDEIGELDAASQVKMLRVLQEHTYEPVGSSLTRRSDFRLVAATNADLQSRIADGTFREDLFYRINLITVELPPLRDRADDIPLLARHFAAKYADITASRPKEFEPEAMEALCRFPFPGNIRQLRNIVERAILTGCGERITTTDLNLPSRVNMPDSTLAATERAAVDEAMARAGGNISKAAALLGISRQALYRRLEKLH